MVLAALGRWLCAVACLAAIFGCSSEPAPGSNGNAGSAGSAAVVAGSGGAAGGGGSPAMVAGTGGTSGSAAGGDAGGLGGAGAGAAGASGGTGGAVSSNLFMGTAQLMVLGSSNELDTCWRALLWQKLGAASIEDFDFVGGVNQGPDCGVAGYDKDLQAQSGTIVTNLTAQQFAGWFSAHPPDALLVHFGGADLLQNMPIAGVIEGYSLMLEQARLVNPQVRVLMGQHTPQTSAGCNDCANTVPELNAQIETWAVQTAKPDSPVVVVDLETGLDPGVDTDDGIHLNMSGSAKVSDRFFAALSPFFGK